MMLKLELYTGASQGHISVQQQATVDKKDGKVVKLLIFFLISLNLGRLLFLEL
jgi:hypothetical protein